MLTSQSLGRYSYKPVSRFEVCLRFFVLILLLGLGLAEGWAQLLIEVPIESLIDCKFLINSDYNFGELGVVNVAWSDPRLAGAIALGRMEYSPRFGQPSLPDVNPMQGIDAQSFAYDSHSNSGLVSRVQGVPNTTSDLNLGVLYIPNTQVEKAGKGAGVMSFREANRQGRVFGSQVDDSDVVIHERGLVAGDMTEDTHSLFNSAKSEGLGRIIEIITIKGSEVIDFAGGTPDNPNILETSMLVIPTDDDMLFITNWVEYSAHLLVEYAPSDKELSRIQFEGYEKGGQLRRYDDTYWEIVPASEAVLYGAIFGAFSIGATAWRKHGRRREL